MPSEPFPPTWLHSLSHNAVTRVPAMLEHLEALVRAESPSDEKASVDGASRLVADWLDASGGKVRWHKQKKFGDLLEARFPARHEDGGDRSTHKLQPILLLGHLDTVWPVGTIRSMPFRISRGRAFGPGIFDMKTGVLMAVHAIAMLDEARLPHPPIVVLLNSEEEIGSPCSRAVTEAIAGECSAVFVLEPALGLRGDLKTARKGVGRYSIHVQGIAAHSGVDFEMGHSAVAELARLIETISGFTDAKRGITVNPGLIRGGSGVNVVAAEAQAEIDVRIVRMRDARRVERSFESLRPTDRACTITVEGDLNRPPMEHNRKTERLFRRAKKLADGMGFELNEASTGGGSDGNFTAALGIPTLDGMGAVGEGAHARHESILLNGLAQRTALLAAMIASQVR